MHRRGKGKKGVGKWYDRPRPGKGSNWGGGTPGTGKTWVRKKKAGGPMGSKKPMGNL